MIASNFVKRRNIVVPLSIPILKRDVTWTSIVFQPKVSTRIISTAWRKPVSWCFVFKKFQGVKPLQLYFTIEICSLSRKKIDVKDFIEISLLICNDGRASKRSKNLEVGRAQWVIHTRFIEQVLNLIWPKNYLFDLNTKLKSMTAFLL